MQHGWFGSPIFFGKYPDIMRTLVDETSSNEGVPSRLPEFTQEESNFIKGKILVLCSLEKLS